MKRAEQRKEDTWKIEDLYINDEAWEKELEEVENLKKDYSKFPGTLGKSSENLLDFLKFDYKVSYLIERLYVYSNQKSHEDLGNTKYQDLSLKAQKIMVEVSGLSAFASPEILEIPEDVLKKFLEENDELKEYNRVLFEIQRRKNHTLDKKTEAILAKSRQMANAPSNIFTLYNGADIDFPTIKDEDGKDVKITHGSYVPLMESANREVRKNAFEGMYSTYRKMINTISAVYSANLEQAKFYADVRGYSSSRAMYLAESNIPESVYDNLIDTVHENMGFMYKYIDLRKKALGVEELHMYDVYTPIVNEVNKKYTFDEAKEIVLKGLAPMGEEYLSNLKKGFENRWIDIYENEGKRSGAYSWGAYGTHPYVLLNFHGTLDHVFTLAHEMGHALHSYYSDNAQPYQTAGYKIFVAEVASTCNESLLIRYMLNNTDDKNEKMYLINHFLDQFKGTLYRQTMFAEFEKITHNMVANGESLTKDSLNKVYYNLNKEYFGEGIVIDKDIELEWARIPHFYNPFYVYQYATGISAAIALSNRILKEGESAVNDYMKFLKGGGSQDPIDLLKMAGVDMTHKEPISQALSLFGNLLDEMEELLN